MAKKRDVVVIGGGAAGLVVASVAAQLGLDVVLINKQADMGAIVYTLVACQVKPY